jgi:RHS repeat-associated protein
LPSSYLNLVNSGKVENLGTLTVNAQGSETGIIHPWSDVTGSVVNAGTLRKSAGTGQSEISVTLTNYEAINAESGSLGLWGETESLMAGSTLAGSISLIGPTVNAQSFSASGTVTVGGSTALTIESGYTATASNLTLQGYVRGAGTLQVSKNLSWASGSMSGKGSTVLLPGAAGTANGVSIYERTLLNEGTLTHSSSYWIVESGAKIDNRGTLNLNAQGTETGLFRVNYATAAPLIVNSGTIQKSSGTGTSETGINLENTGTVKGTTGTLDIDGEATSLKNGSVLEGSVSFRGGPETVLAQNITASNATVFSGASTTFSVEGGKTAKVGNFSLSGGFLNGSGTLQISKAFSITNGSLSGAGKTVLLPTGTGIISGSSISNGYALVNEGTTTLPGSYLSMRSGAKLENRGIFNANTEGFEHAILLTTPSGSEPAIVNSGIFQKTSGSGTTEVEPIFENYGVVRALTGTLKIIRPRKLSASEQAGHNCITADPVECATGNLAEEQTDFQIPGLGIGLNLSRSYSAQAAVAATAPGAFGYGWTNSFGDKLLSEEGGSKVKLTQADGATITFTKSGSSWLPPAWSQYSLTGSSGTGYTLTLPTQVNYAFSGAGRLQSITDRNGNATTLAYDGSGRLKTITDPAGRQIALTYNGEGLVEQAEDPMGHVVKYAYEGKNLAKVTEPGETEPRWQFKYDGSHRMTTMTDGRGGKTTNQYDGSSRVAAQVDPAGRETTFEYAPFHTKITNKATGAVTDEWFTSYNQPFSVTHGFGTAAATTQTFAYDPAGHLLSATDGNGHTTTYGYDEAGNRTSEKDPLGHEVKWAFNGTYDLISTTTPGGETTTIARDGKGNVESISRPAPGEETQTTVFAHDEHGQLESLTDPLERTWSFGYDAYGDRTSETDPLGHEQTSAYDADSRLVAITTPRGNLEGAEPAKYTTTIERDAQGRPLKVTGPLGATTKYAYDGNGNLASVTDAKSHVTKYTYNADDERTKVEKPNGATLQTAYDGTGAVISQTDGNGKTTIYVRNALEQPIEVIDPLGRKTTESFDAAGNLVGLVDPAERETTYSYDLAGHLTGIDYSEEATPDASFEYDADGNVVAMTDGTGESTFAYDQLGRLTQSEDGHGTAVEYGYDLGEEQTGIVYPNGKAVAREYDAAGRLESITDWLGGTTSFGYDADSNLTGITFPAESGNVDEYAYDRALRMSGATFKQGSETLASLSYVRDALGQVESEARNGLPGAEEVSYGYDQNNRLVEAGSGSFEYDAADNLTKGNGSTNTYDAASQLETGTGVTYSYDKTGERIKATPSSGPTTSYGYDQAGNLISVSRSEEGEVSAIAESMTYDATGLLASKTSGLATQHLSWDQSTGLSLLLADEGDSYIYGPNGLPIEQIFSAETPTYLHHDQLGSTRMLSDEAGEVSATFSYAPYGSLEAQTGSAATLLGFAGQLTDAESSLQYLRARFYDPATGQFITQDPAVGVTHEPYLYAGDNPMRFTDPSGLSIAEELEGIGVPCFECGAEGAVELLEPAYHDAEWVLQHSLGVEELDEPSGQGAAEEAEDDLCLEPRTDPWEYETAIGDPGQEMTDAGNFVRQENISAGSNPENPYGNGPRWKQIAAAIGRLVSEFVKPGGR